MQSADPFDTPLEGERATCNQKVKPDAEFTRGTRLSGSQLLSHFSSSVEEDIDQEDDMQPSGG